MTSPSYAISALRPGLQSWTITGRCTDHRPLKSIQNGKGQMTNFEISDGTESIRVTAFDDVAVHVNQIIRVGDRYVVSNSGITLASRYNTTTRLEIRVDSIAAVTPIERDSSPSTTFHSAPSARESNGYRTSFAQFRTIAEIRRLPNDTVVNTVGEVSRIDALTQTNRDVKRQITIQDESHASISVTLWRKMAGSLLSEEDLPRRPVLLFLDAKVWRGASGAVRLSVNDSTRIERDPTHIDGYTGSLLQSRVPVLSRMLPPGTNTASATMPMPQPSAYIQTDSSSGSVHAIPLVDQTGLSNHFARLDTSGSNALPYIPQPTPRPLPPGQTVFVSHSGVDKETVALPLGRALESLGVSCFVDRDKHGVGDQAAEVMSRAMQTAMIGVILLSPEFVGCKWPIREMRCFMDRRREAIRAGKVPPVIIPVFHRWTIEDCKDPLFHVTHGALLRQKGFFDPDRQKEAPTDLVGSYLREIAEITGIEGDAIRARNEDNSRSKEGTVSRLLGMGMGSKSKDAKNKEARYNEALVGAIKAAVFRNLDRLTQT